MVQLARNVEGLPAPVRQHVLSSRAGNFVAQIDLCWPELGLFIELDGEQIPLTPANACKIRAGIRRCCARPCAASART